ncbi:MAG TPA: helix-turn-helix domain-containing protein [Gemmatimonadaceae bacterium]|nr:helix-turn-helix domain-containing protein [Gemmatimonadaceae bacterium]
MGCHTQKALAEQLGVTQPRVSQILTGAYPIRPGPLLTLVRELQAQYIHGRKVRA